MAQLTSDYDIYKNPKDLADCFSSHDFYPNRPYHQMGKELMKRPTLWKKIIAFEETVYIASSDVDDDKLELLGKAMKADTVWAYDRDSLLESTVSWINDKKQYCDKTYLRALRDWLRKLDPETTIWKFWWD